MQTVVAFIIAQSQDEQPDVPWGALLFGAFIVFIIIQYFKGREKGAANRDRIDKLEERVDRLDETKDDQAD